MSDPEKAVPENVTEEIKVSSSSTTSDDVLPIHVPRTVSKWNKAIESLSGLEARGISRVPPNERETPSLMGYVQMTILWYSANITANNLAVGFLGPILFQLGFLDCALIVVFSCWLGALGPAYTAIFGPQSGHRTMVSLSRYRSCGSAPQSLTIRTGNCALFHGLLASQTDCSP